jgi:N-acetylneuraminate synthase/N,N'-diacetyllegionaminate synthase
VRIFERDLEHDIAVVAEIGVNHEGDVEAATKMIGAAADAGADAVKIQSYTPWRYAAANNPERLAQVSRFALDEAAHRDLAAHAHDRGIAFLSTPLTEDWVPLLGELSTAIKVASGDLTFEPTIRAAAATGLPVLISTGLGTIDEIDGATRWMREEIGEAPLGERLVLLHCVVAYPTPIEEANLACIGLMRDRYAVPVGWSNHVIGPDACLAAAALGAAVIEVHMTDRREGKTFRDHEMSFEPQELASVIDQLRRVRAAIGEPRKERTVTETPLLGAVRKGVVAATDLAAGTRLRAVDLAFARPATEFSAAEAASLVGGRLTVDLVRGALVPRSGVELPVR